jgi:hypothetical protein
MLINPKESIHNLARKVGFILLLLVFSVPISNCLATDYYSYQSGDWATSLNWTTDPSGTTLVGSAVPGAADNITILNGRNIFTLINRTTVNTTIDLGGTLDLTTTTACNLGVVLGQGLLRLSSTTFPLGTFTTFVSSAGGSIEYYNVGGVCTNLPNQLTYKNLIYQIRV